MKPQKLSRHEWIILLYTLLHDTLLLISVSLFGFVLAEAILPGFLSTKISFLTLILLLMLNIAALTYLHQSPLLAHHSSPKEPTSHISNKIWIFLVLFGILILLTALYKYSLFASLFLFAATGVTIYLLYTLFVSPKK